MNTFSMSIFSKVSKFLNENPVININLMLYHKYILPFLPSPPLQLKGTKTLINFQSKQQENQQFKCQNK